MIPSTQLVSLIRRRQQTDGARGTAMQMLRRKGTQAPGPRQRDFLQELLHANGAPSVVPTSALAAVAEAVLAENPGISANQAVMRAHDLIDSLLPGGAHR